MQMTGHQPNAYQIHIASCLTELSQREVTVFNVNSVKSSLMFLTGTYAQIFGRKDSTVMK